MSIADYREALTENENPIDAPGTSVKLTKVIDKQLTEF
jgi:hypothetical protein